MIAAASAAAASAEGARPKKRRKQGTRPSQPEPPTEAKGGAEAWVRSLHKKVRQIEELKASLEALKGGELSQRTRVEYQLAEAEKREEKASGKGKTTGAGKTSAAKHPPKSQLTISNPREFRQVSAIIDVDVVPETCRRVKLLKHGSDKPLGFYIRDGTSVRVTPQGLEKVPGIFISRLVPGGLAESTGLLAVNDEGLEVNGIEVAGRAPDQVAQVILDLPRSTRQIKSRIVKRVD